MTTKEMSIRDLVRNGSQLPKYDFVDISDKKSKTYKGIFISARHANSVKKFLIKKLKKEKENKISNIMSFSGMATGLFENKNIQDIKTLHE